MKVHGSQRAKMQKVQGPRAGAGRWAAACCRQVLVFMKVLEKSPRLSRRLYWEGAEVTVGGKLLIWDFQPHQAGALRWFPELGTKSLYLNTLIVFPGKVTEGNQYLQLHKPYVIFIKTSHRITYIARLERFFWQIQRWACVKIII